MDDVAMSQVALQTPAEYETAIEQILAEIKSLNEAMQTDRSDIEQIRNESSILKTETQRLKSEARAALVRLGETV